MSDPDGTILFRGTPRSLRRGEVRRFYRLLRQQLCAARPFNCLITGDRELHRLNREFLGKDYPTDVLSFPASPGPPEGFLGEIAISAARAQQQAAAFGHSTEEEIAILMLHGLLHLLGMDHQRDRGAMRLVERRWRGILGLPQGLIDRSRP